MFVCDRSNSLSHNLRRNRSETGIGSQISLNNLVKRCQVAQEFKFYESDQLNLNSRLKIQRDNREQDILSSGKSYDLILKENLTGI